MNIRNIVYLPRKRVVWIGSSHDDIRAVPAEARRLLGRNLDLVQLGGTPRDWKLVTTVGPGVIEIRVRAEGAFRLIYVAKFVEAIYVLHVFQKKTQKTSHLDIAVARARLAMVQRTRLGGE